MFILMPNPVDNAMPAIVNPPVSNGPNPPVDDVMPTMTVPPGGRENNPNENPYEYAIKKIAENSRPTSTTNQTCSPQGRPPQDSQSHDDFIPAPIRYTVQGVLAPAAGNYIFRLANTAAPAAQTSRTGGIFGFLGRVTGGIFSALGRVTGLSKYFNFVGRLGNLGVGAKALGACGGRLIPGIGCGLAIFDVVNDLTNLDTMKKQEGETNEKFQQRLSTARTDAWINVGCTAGGAAIGAVVCGVLTLGVGAGVGAMIGAGIGNLVGNAFKSGGIGRRLFGGIGRLFG